MPRAGEAERRAARRPAERAVKPLVKRVRRPRTDPDVAREAVLDAAEELLRAEGPSALRLGAIAARAGLSHSNVLYHFEGMTDLEARLGRRIAMRLVAELGDLHRASSADAIPSVESNRHLFSVLSQPENARLIWWMLMSSDAGELEPLRDAIRAACEDVARHPSLADLPREAVMREIVDGTEVSIAAALGLGIIRPWVTSIFGTPPNEAMFVERLGSIDPARIKRHVGERSER